MTPHSTARAHDHLSDYHRIMAISAATVQQRQHHENLQKLLADEAKRIWTLVEDEYEPSFDGN